MRKTVRLTVCALCLLLAISVVLPAASAAADLGNFKSTKTFSDTYFKDVSKNDWFYDGVKSAYEFGLMKGSGNGFFNPKGDLTVAEALAIACRIHSTYNDNGEQFVQSGTWYEVYVDYAVRNGIMSANKLQPTKKITREEFAYLMCGTLPDSALPAINNISKIPDVEDSSAYKEYIYRLYNAGVLRGNDDSGTFAPTTTIQRSAVATIVTRMANSSLRVKSTTKENGEKKTDAETPTIRMVVNKAKDDFSTDASLHMMHYDYNKKVLNLDTWKYEYVNDEVWVHVVLNDESLETLDLEYKTMSSKTAVTKTGNVTVTKDKPAQFRIDDYYFFGNVKSIEVGYNLLRHGVVSEERQEDAVVTIYIYNKNTNELIMRRDITVTRHYTVIDERIMTQKQYDYFS